MRGGGIADVYIYGVLECWDLAGIHVGSPELLGFNTGWGVMCISGLHVGVLGRGTSIFRSSAWLGLDPHSCYKYVKLHDILPRESMPRCGAREARASGWFVLRLRFETVILMHRSVSKPQLLSKAPRYAPAQHGYRLPAV